MADDGRLNPEGRSNAEDRRGALICCARRLKAGEKSANRRFQTPAVRHRSIEQKQGYERLIGHRSGDGMVQARRDPVTCRDRPGSVGARFSLSRGTFFPLAAPGD